MKEIASKHQPLTVTSRTFQSEVIEAREPVLLDFYADWCPPCQLLSPILDELAAGLGPAVRVAKVNIDESPELAEAFGVRSIPTLVFLDEGEEFDRHVGVASPGELRSRLLQRAAR